MTTSRLALTLREINDETVFLTLTKEGAPFDLTGATVEMVIKKNVVTPDDDPTSFLLSTETGEITITDPAAGLATVEISSATVTAIAVKNWAFRVDVLIGGKRKTAGYGTLNITDL
jgi:hypothetical protein